jgi:Lon protease-like protein
VCYFNKRSDGLLGVTLRGMQRFRILHSTVQPNQLIVAEIDTLPNAPACPVQGKYIAMAELLKKILDQLEPPYTTMQQQFDDLEWVSARLCELLPLPLSYKQRMLHIDDTFERLDLLHRHLYQIETA